MEAPAQISKCITALVPSLSHFSLVKVAFPLFRGFDKKTWETLYQEMELMGPANFYECRSENPEVNKAKEKLRLIPPHLRLEILQTILGLNSVIVQWRANHPLLQNDLNDHVFFKTDGSVNRVKTVQYMLVDEKISIESRFDLACAYFLGKCIRALWAEMQDSGKATKPLSAYNPVSQFWIKRMRRKYRTPWIYSVQLHLDLPDQFLDIPIPRFGAFFPYLRPIDRSKFLKPLMKAPPDDFLLCLCSATKSEELKVLRMDIRKVVFVYLEWPRQSFFLEIMGKLWKHITYSLFVALLEIIYLYHMRKRDFDYGTLFVDFWERSPDDLKQEAKASPIFYNRVKSRLDAIKKKRKGESGESGSKRRRYESSSDVDPSLFNAYLIPHLQQLNMPLNE